MLSAIKVKSLVDKYGRSATLTHTPLTYSAVTGKSTAGTLVVTTLKIIPPYPYKESYIDGDLIKAGDMQSGVAALDVTPARNDKLTLGSDVWTVMSVEPLGVQDTMLVYLLQLRK